MVCLPGAGGSAPRRQSSGRTAGIRSFLGEHPRDRFVVRLVAIKEEADRLPYLAHERGVALGDLLPPQECAFVIG